MGRLFYSCLWFFIDQKNFIAVSHNDHSTKTKKQNENGMIPPGHRIGIRALHGTSPQFQPVRCARNIMPLNLA